MVPMFASAVTGLIPQADSINAAVLSANVAQVITIPPGSNKILFGVSGGNDFYMRLGNKSIAVPAASVTDGSAPELNPLLRDCTGQTAVAVISASDCIVTMGFYS